MKWSLILKGIRAMSKNEADGDRRVLPKPVTLTPEEAPLVAAGFGEGLLPSGIAVFVGGIIDILYGSSKKLTTETKG
jgi:hypothetical protein